MDIDGIVSSALDTAWTLAAQALIAGTYREGRSATYNPTTDVSTPTWTYSAALSVLKFDDTRLDPEGKPHSPGRSVLIIRQKDMPGGVKRPSTEGQVELTEDGGTVTYDVVAVEDVPAKSIWLLTVTERRIAA